MDVSAQQGSVLGMHVSPSLLRAPNVPDGYSSDIVPFARVLKHFSAFVVRDIEGLALGLTVGAIVGESLGDKEGIGVGVEVGVEVGAEVGAEVGVEVGDSV